MTRKRRERMTRAARRHLRDSMAFGRIHEHRRALRSMRAALRHAPDNVTLLHEEAWYLARLGYKATALRAYKRISRLSRRRDGSADLEACSLALALGREKEARRLLNRALKRQPDLIFEAQEDERVSRLLNEP